MQYSAEIDLPKMQYSAEIDLPKMQYSAGRLFADRTDREPVVAAAGLRYKSVPLAAKHCFLLC